MKHFSKYSLFNVFDFVTPTHLYVQFVQYYNTMIVHQIRGMRRTRGGVGGVRRPGQRKCELGLIF